MEYNNSESINNNNENKFRDSMEIYAPVILALFLAVKKIFFLFHVIKIILFLLEVMYLRN